MDNFKENNKLFSFSGVLNRRNYIINLLLAETIVQALIATPLLVIAFINNNIAGAILGGGEMPKWWNIILLTSSLFSSTMYISSIVRRSRDLFGYTGENNIKPFAVFTFIILILGTPSFLSENFIFAFLRLMGLGILISLACIKGEITGNLPKNEIIEFNWGAFFGNWMWGLFNKCYITLLAIPLSFTLGGLPFFIVCGLKGNEWAYEKCSNKNVALFKSNQKIHTIIWSVGIPIILFMLFISASIGIYNYTTQYSKTHPDFTKNIIEYYVSMESKAAISRFDKIEFKDNEYKFYINPKKWKTATYKQKISDFDMALNYVTAQNLDKDNLLESFSPLTTEQFMNKIKIYSTFNNELLGEFKLENTTLTELLEQTKINPKNKINILKEIQKGYIFNSYPSLP